MTEIERAIVLTQGIPMPKAQKMCILDMLSGEDAEGYAENIMRIRNMLDSMPPLASGIKIANLHYFKGGADWYISEYDPETGEVFGWARLLAGCGEYGYGSIREIAENLELDLYFTPKPFSEVID